MNKLLLIIPLVLTTILSFAQLREGHIVYKIDFSSDKPDLQAQMAMFQGSTLDVYFKDQSTRSNMTFGTVMSMTTISSQEQILMLMDGMMGKKAIKSNMKDLASHAEEKNENVKVRLDKDTKEILGYKCKKAVLSDPEGNEMIFWYTEEIEMNKKGQKNLSADIPGVALEYEIMQQGMTMIMRATTIEKKLEKKDKNCFDLTIPEGYTTLTEEEAAQMGLGN